MPIKLTCRGCETPVEADEADRGKKMNCAICWTEVTVPVAASSEAAADGPVPVAKVLPTTANLPTANRVTKSVTGEAEKASPVAPVVEDNPLDFRAHKQANPTPKRGSRSGAKRGSPVLKAFLILSAIISLPLIVVCGGCGLIFYESYWPYFKAGYDRELAKQTANQTATQSPEQKTELPPVIRDEPRITVPTTKGLEPPSAPPKPAWTKKWEPVTDQNNFLAQLPVKNTQNWKTELWLQGQNVQYVSGHIWQGQDPLFTHRIEYYDLPSGLDSTPDAILRAVCSAKSGTLAPEYAIKSVVVDGRVAPVLAWQAEGTFTVAAAVKIGRRVFIFSQFRMPSLDTSMTGFDPQRAFLDFLETVQIRYNPLETHKEPAWKTKWAVVTQPKNFSVNMPPNPQKSVHKLTIGTDEISGQVLESLEGHLTYRVAFYDVHSDLNLTVTRLADHLYDTMRISPEIQQARSLTTVDGASATSIAFSRNVLTTNARIVKLGSRFFVFSVYRESNSDKQYRDLDPEATSKDFFASIRLSYDPNTPVFPHEPAWRTKWAAVIEPNNFTATMPPNLESKPHKLTVFGEEVRGHVVESREAHLTYMIAFYDLPANWKASASYLARHIYGQTKSGSSPSIFSRIRNGVYVDHQELSVDGKTIVVYSHQSGNRAFIYSISRDAKRDTSFRGFSMAAASDDFFNSVKITYDPKAVAPPTAPPMTPPIAKVPQNTAPPAQQEPAWRTQWASFTQPRNFSANMPPKPQTSDSGLTLQNHPIHGQTVVSQEATVRYCVGWYDIPNSLKMTLQEYAAFFHNRDKEYKLEKTRFGPTEITGYPVEEYSFVGKQFTWVTCSLKVGCRLYVISVRRDPGSEAKYLGFDFAKLSRDFLHSIKIDFDPKTLAPPGRDEDPVPMRPDQMHLTNSEAFKLITQVPPHLTSVYLSDRKQILTLIPMPSQTVLQVLSAESFRVIRSVNLPPQLMHLAVDEKANRLFVGGGFMNGQLGGLVGKNPKSDLAVYDLAKLLDPAAGDATPKPLQTKTFNTRLMGLALHPDGKSLFIGTNLPAFNEAKIKNTVGKLDATTLEKLAEIEAAEAVTGLRLSPNGKTLMVYERIDTSLDMMGMSAKLLAPVEIIDATTLTKTRRADLRGLSSDLRFINDESAVVMSVIDRESRLFLLKINGEMIDISPTDSRFRFTQMGFLATQSGSNRLFVTDRMTSGLGVYDFKPDGTAKAKRLGSISAIQGARFGGPVTLLPGGKIAIIAAGAVVDVSELN
jgi:hypothetical protein